MSRSSRPSDWMANLPLVLLGIRSSTRDDSAVSPAHLLYGAPLRLPGEFFLSGTSSVPTSDFVAQLQRSLREMSPFPAEFHSKLGHSPAAIPAALGTCPAVFVRVDAVKRPLTQPYSGPYSVLERTEKTFTLLRAGKPWTVSVDRLKPYFLPIMSAPSSTLSSSPSTPSPATPSAGQSPPAAAPASSLVTRYGRTVRPPHRLGF